MIPNGVDVGKFHPRWPTPALRLELDLPPEVPTAAIVAALRPEKNHELFLRAAAIVHRQMPQVQFLVVGDGPRRAELEFSQDNCRWTSRSAFSAPGGTFPSCWR